MRWEVLGAKGQQMNTAVTAAEKAAILAHYTAQASQVDWGASPEYRDELSRTQASVSGADFTDELVDHGDLLVKLARIGNASAIGTLVIACFESYTRRCAERVVFGDAS